MAWIWWVVGCTCGGLTLVAVVAVGWLFWSGNQMAKEKLRVIAEGDQTTAWIVLANQVLGGDWLALVLISPDGRTAADEALMTELVEYVMQFKDVDPADCQDDDEAFVAELMASEKYRYGKRDMLPRALANGRKVFLAHLYAYHDHLPQSGIDSSNIPCSVIWDEPKSLICTRPMKELRRGSADC